ncbi:Helicase [Macleaya cordata]|uniref:RNA helicase n=1 Tax=Macleaya cordata TaxID=56857 RepID=A0A200Q5Z2_MACCD|nr:Helicase [Macleaya cordata]
MEGGKRDRDRDKERNRDDRHKNRDKVRNRVSLWPRSERERSVDDKYGEKHRDRDSRHKESEKDQKRSLEEDRERIREKEKDRALDRDEDRDDNGKEHDRKRRKRENPRSRSYKHRDDNDDARRKKSEEDLEEDRRRRRVRKWWEFKRKTEEFERGKQGEANHDVSKSGKNWTLEGESDDEEAVPPSKLDIEIEMHMGEDSKDETTLLATENGDGGTNGEEEIDPLDAFMNSMVLPEVQKLNNAETSLKVDDNKSDPRRMDQKDCDQPRKIRNKSVGRIIQGKDSDSDYEDPLNDNVLLEDEDDDEFIKRLKKTKAENFSVVDHTKIQYSAFRKNLYNEVKEISRMASEEVVAYRKQLELKLHGKDVPKPIKTWIQTGLTSKILDTIRKLGYEKPMPIQAQALPIIMSGRDCIGVAKTGSGKTLAFVLPMLRHIKDQPPVVPGDGPIGLIMAPTRELVQQIHSDIRKFSKVMGVNSVPIYGGSGVAQQISELKRGAEIVSITRIIHNIRPDRQTVLFSATFPRQVEILARKVLTKPVEIQVGGKNVVNKDISQLVEVRPENERFLRLLELLGEWYEKGKILIFVHSQEKCDSLFKDLLKHGYPCLSLHGAKDQTDRESTISDFKSNVCNLLIATSIAARGLDVKELELVINFDVPNHYEDYVHRVGRTGRAGRKGCAITFISDEDARYAPDLVKALELSEQGVPEDLKALADGFMAKVNQGHEQAHGGGYGGSGFKFNEDEDGMRIAAKKAKAREYGFEEDKSDSDSEDEGIRKAGGDLSQQAALAQAAALAAAASKIPMALMPTPISAAHLLPNGGIPVTPHGVMGIPIPGTAEVLPSTTLSIPINEGTAWVEALNLQHKLAKIQADAMPEHYEAEFEINDFPQNARWKVTHKGTLGPISEWTGAAITTRGKYYPPGKISGPVERKLYLLIEGPTESSVKRAKDEVKRVLEDITKQALSFPSASRPGKYSGL